MNKTDRQVAIINRKAALPVSKRLAVSLAKKLHKTHKGNKHSNRGWSVGRNFASTTPFLFDYKLYDPTSYDEMWQMNIDLRKAMTDHWLEIVDDEDAQAELSVWVIRDWGGIRSNNKRSLDKHVYEARNFSRTYGKKGVASYSKLLSAKNYEKNFILDARVAVALNVLQLEYFGGHRYFFDVLATQNKDIATFNKKYSSKKYIDVGFVGLDEEIYIFYNELILMMAEYLNLRGIEVEMMLFDNAINIISDTDEIDNLYQQNKTYWSKRLEDWKLRKIRKTERRLREKKLM